MKIIIETEPKEIADLVLHLQNQLKKEVEIKIVSNMESSLIKAFENIKC